MELKYVWIEEYKNIKATGFNFNHSGRDVFEYTLGGELIISQGFKQPENFFKNNITGVTAIVGANGAGKTNLTEFINFNLAHVTNGGLAAYLKSKGIIIISNWIFVQKKISIKNIKEVKSNGYEVIFFNKVPLDRGQGELRWYKMENNKYIPVVHL